MLGGSSGDLEMVILMMLGGSLGDLEMVILMIGNAEWKGHFDFQRIYEPNYGT